MSSFHGSTTTPEPTPSTGFFSVFRFSRKAMELVWSTSRKLTIALGGLTLVSGVVPAGIAYVGALIVDAVVAAATAYQDSGEADYALVFQWVALEAALMLLQAASQRGISMCQSLLRAQLGQRVNVMILEKALTLKLEQFEDSEFYDKLTRARREASSRPLSLVTRTFGLVQNLIALISFGVLLVQFSPWALAVLALAGLPAFFAETKFSGDAYRLFRWRSPDTRKQMYLEMVMAREDHAKEVKLYDLGPKMLEGYNNIFRKLYSEDRKLTIRRDTWGFLLGGLGTLALYGAYAWTAATTVLGQITLGQMTMYIMLFRQGQSAVSSILSAVSGMYEDNLYLSTLYEFMDTPVAGTDGHLTQGPEPGDGIRFENVSFTYPDTESPALQDISLHVKPGQSLALVGENGAGKTTLIKLLTRLYQPTTGRILLDGADLADWDEATLLRRVGVIFQDFMRYQLTVGENVGAGDVRYFEDEQRWHRASDKGLATPMIEQLPEGYQTQLGKWFMKGRELSGGQWQKIAMARAFMREDADILVLDEPTAAMDAAAEATIFEHFQNLTQDRIAILISHRFSTVRMANHIVVIEDGRIIEQGSHETLMEIQGIYERLFSLQARGYR